MWSERHGAQHEHREPDSPSPQGGRVGQLSRRLPFELVGAVKKGVAIRPSKLTFGEYVTEWLEGLDARPRSIEAYRSRVDTHLVRFKRRKLTDISVDDVARLLVDMKRQGYSPATVTAVLATLSSCLGLAERRGLIPGNPVSKLTRHERPHVLRKPRRVLDGAELSKLLNSSGKHHSFVAFLAYTGTRIGECLAGAGRTSTSSAGSCMSATS
jgi:integrase